MHSRANECELEECDVDFNMGIRLATCGKYATSKAAALRERPPLQHEHDFVDAQVVAIFCVNKRFVEITNVDQLFSEYSPDAASAFASAVGWQLHSHHGVASGSETRFEQVDLTLALQFTNEIVLTRSVRRILARVRLHVTSTPANRVRLHWLH